MWLFCQYNELYQVWWIYHFRLDLILYLFAWVQLHYLLKVIFHAYYETQAFLYSYTSIL